MRGSEKFHAVCTDLSPVFYGDGGHHSGGPAVQRDDRQRRQCVGLRGYSGGGGFRTIGEGCNTRKVTVTRIYRGGLDQNTCKTKKYALYLIYKVLFRKM